MTPVSGAFTTCIQHLHIQCCALNRIQTVRVCLTLFLDTITLMQDSVVQEFVRLNDAF